MCGLITLGIGLLVFGKPAGAQMTPADFVDPYSDDDGYDARYPHTGGFGLGYSPMVRAGGFVEDRFGIMQPTVATSAALSERTSRVDPSRVRRKTVRNGPRPSIALPTGSLYWPAASGVSLYSPQARFRSYGAGYGAGPYGSADHGIMYKGWSLEN
jgi:hypothetical protein